MAVEFPPKPNAASCVPAPEPANACLAVFIVPPVTQTPYAKSAFHSSVAPVADGVAPPKPNAAVLVPALPKPYLAVAISLVSVQLVPSHNSVFVILGGPPAKANPDELLVPAPPALCLSVFKSFTSYHADPFQTSVV